MVGAMRLFALVFFSSLAVGAPPRFVSAGDCVNPAWQPGGALIACTVEISFDDTGGFYSRKGLAVVDSASGAERAFVLGAAGPHTFSHDGKRIAAMTRFPGARSSDLYVFDVDGSHGVFIGTDETLYDAPTWDPADAVIHVTRRYLEKDTEVATFPTVRGARSGQYCAPCAAVAIAAGERYATRVHEGVNLFDPRASPANRVFPFPTIPKSPFEQYPVWQGPSFSPDGRWLAVVAGEKGAFMAMGLYALDTRVPAGRFKRLGPTTADLAWSPDSTAIATTDESGKVVAYNVGDGKRRDLVAPDRAGCRVLSPAWSPAGLAVVHACEKRELRIYRP
jgi:hypothetical protein